MSAQVRAKLARISARPPAEWTKHLEQEFPGDAAMCMQALLWLHAEKQAQQLEGGVPPSLGDAADERYELTVQLETDATASVWQAFDRRLGRDVAIKVFHERIGSEAADARDVLEVQHGDGCSFIVMENGLETR